MNSIRSPLRNTLRTFARSSKPSPTTFRYIYSSPSRTNRPSSIVLDTVGIFAAFGVLTYAFSSVGSALRLDAKPIEGAESVEPESAFLFATGGQIKDPKAPVFTRDQVTVIVVIGSPKAGKTTNVMKIAKKFDAQVELADSDIYSDIALNLPTAHLSNPHGSSKLRIVVDDFAATSPDPLAQALQFEESIAPILLFIFVDCPLKDAELRVDEKDRSTLANEYAAWHRRTKPLIDHYRHKANFLEITGQWPADEQWEQVEAKLESALELEARGDL